MNSVRQHPPRSAFSLRRLVFRLGVTMETVHLVAECQVRGLRPVEKSGPNFEHNKFTIKVEQYFVVKPQFHFLKRLKGIF